MSEGEEEKKRGEGERGGNTHVFLRFGRPYILYPYLRERKKRRREPRREGEGRGKRKKKKREREEEEPHTASGHLVTFSQKDTLQGSTKKNKKKKKTKKGKGGRKKKEEKKGRKKGEIYLHHLI